MNNYEVLSVVGTGAYGAVLKVRRKADGRILVWKQINYGAMTEKQKQQLVTEVNVLRLLNSPNIVKYFDRVLDKTNTKVYLVMEFCEGGDLSRIINRAKKDQELISEDLVWRLFSQLVNALNDCHMHKEGKVLHRDLKPGNVFLDAGGNVKLGDFGLAKVMGEETKYATTNVGTPLYMSPEQLKEGRYNEKSDIWSAGILLYELAALRVPFGADSMVSLANKIQSCHFDPIPGTYSAELQRVIAWMLSLDPNQRPSTQDLLNIPQVAMRLRERRIRENMGVLRKKEEEIRLLEAEVARLELELQQGSGDLFPSESTSEASPEANQQVDHSFLEALEKPEVRRSTSPISRTIPKRNGSADVTGNKENEALDTKKSRVQRAVPRLPLSRVNRLGV